MNNGEYLKILKQFILDEQEKGTDGEEIRRILELKHWPAEMVNVVFEEIYREERESKFDVNKIATEKKNPVEKIPASTWYQPTWSVGRTWMTDGDGGLPNKKNQRLTDKVLTETVILENQTQELPLPELPKNNKKEKNTAEKIKKTPENLPAKTENVPAYLQSAGDINAEKIKKELVAAPPKTDFPIKNQISKPDSAGAATSGLLTEKIARDWPRVDSTTKQVVAKKKANRFGYILLITILLAVLGLAIFYRFYYQTPPAASNEISPNLTNSESNLELSASPSAVILAENESSSNSGEINPATNEAILTQGVSEINSLPSNNGSTALGRLLR